jgi:hypothetical protein
MENRPTLLWGIDSCSDEITALPASPLLLPAAIVFGLLYIVSLFIPNRPVKKQISSKFNSSEYYQNKMIYDRLCAKIEAGIPLTENEQIQINYQLPRPSWAEPGEWWSY